MVTVVIKKNENGSYSGFTCSGHADFDEAGYDIVCSAISILVLNTINSIATLTYNNMECDSDEVTGDKRYYNSHLRKNPYKMWKNEA